MLILKMQAIGAIDSTPVSEEDMKMAIQTVIAHLDKNGDGKIQFSEILSALCEGIGFADEAAMEASFLKLECTEEQYQEMMTKLKEFCGV